MKGIRKMDEMELQITLPAFLLGAQVMIFCLVQWIGRARAGDDRVKREFVLWVILTVALLTFSLLLVLGG